MKNIKITGDTNALVDELRDIRARKKKDEKRETEITTRLKEITEQEPASLMFNAKLVALLEESESTRLDSDKIRSLHPDVAAECSVSLRFLKVKVC